MNDYGETYTKLYANNYPAGPVLSLWDWAAPRIKWPSTRILDVGCGRGLLYNAVKKNAEYIGIDAAIIDNTTRNDVDQPFFVHDAVEYSILDRFGDFDIAVCCDVLEHIYEDDLDAFIEHIVAVSQVQVLSISCRASNFKDPEGNGLHVTVRPASWWIDRLSEYTDILIQQTLGSDLYLICGDDSYLETGSSVPTVPNSVRGQRIRHHSDGTFSIPRQDVQAVKVLDQSFRRAGRLRWCLPPVGGSKLSDLGIGESVCIIGKGPSLDTYDLEDLKGYDTIICINDAWKSIPDLKDDERLIVCQIDTGFGDTNVVAPMLVSQINASEFVHSPYPVHIRNTHSDGNISASVAVSACREAGAKYITFLAFDACTKGVTDYADSVGYSAAKAGDPKRFLNHKKKILAALGPLPHTFK